MSWVMHVIPELDSKGLREFGYVTGGIVAGLFGVFFPWLLEISYPLWPWIVCAVLVLWGLIAPVTLRPVYRGWMHFGLVLSRITTPLIMGIVFFGVIVPVGMVMRIFGRDAMARRFENDAKTYRVKSEKQPREKMEKPF